MLWIVTAKFLIVRQRSYKEKGEASMNPVVLDWNWRYHYECMGFRVHMYVCTQIDTKIDQYVCMCQ